MSKAKLLHLLLSLEAYEMGNEGMFDGWFDDTVWSKTHGRSEKTHERIISELADDEAQKQLESILDSLAQYDCEDSGMFDYILIENGREQPRVQSK